MTILGLHTYNLKEQDIFQNENLLISGFLCFKYYNNEAKLKPLSPKERGKIICQNLRDGLKEAKAILQHESYDLRGTKFKPRGLDLKLTSLELKRLKELNSENIESFFLDDIEGLQKHTETTNSGYFSVKVHIGTFIEGNENSISEIEERIVLVKALNFEEAEEKAKKEIDIYCDLTYLNNQYKYVTFKLLEIIDVFQLSENEINSEGTEVYSKIKQKRIKINLQN